MDGYRFRDSYVSPERQKKERDKRDREDSENKEKHLRNSEAVYKALVIEIDENKLFQNNKNLADACQILSNVGKDILYSDQKSLAEKGLAFGNGDGGSDYFDIVYTSMDNKDYATSKAIYTLIGEIFNKFNNNPEKLQEMLSFTFQHLPQETLTICGEKFHQNKLDENALKAISGAMNGERFSTDRTSYKKVDKEPKSQTFLLMKEMINKGLLEHNPIYVINGIFNYSTHIEELKKIFEEHNIVTQSGERLKLGLPLSGEHEKLAMISKINASAEWLPDLLSQLNPDNNREVYTFWETIGEIENSEEISAIINQVNKTNPQPTIFTKILSARETYLQTFPTQESVFKLKDQIYTLKKNNQKALGTLIFEENAIDAEKTYALVNSNTNHYSEAKQQYDEIGFGSTWETLVLLIDAEKMKSNKRKSMELVIPEDLVGRFIGKDGRNIKLLGEKYGKIFQIKKMSAAEVSKHKEYSVDENKIYSEEVLNLIKKEDNMRAILGEHKSQQQEKQRIIYKDIDVFASQENMTAEQYILSQVINEKEGKVEFFLNGPNNPYSTDAIHYQFHRTFKNNILEKKILSSQHEFATDAPQIPMYDDASLGFFAISAEAKIKTAELEVQLKEAQQLQQEILEQKRKEKEDNKRHQETEAKQKEEYYSAIEDAIQKQLGDSFTSTDNKSMVLNISQYLADNKKQIIFNIDVKDIIKIRDNLIEKRDICIKEEEKRKEEIKNSPVSPAKTEDVNTDSVDSKYKDDTSISDNNQNEYLKDEEYEEPIERTQEQIAEEKAKIKAAKKAYKQQQTQQTIPNGLAGLAALQGKNGFGK